MATADTPRPRGRPRRFDPEQAVATAQRLFHARGYDAVSVSDVTDALGINPPSFYAAFGSKAGLYERVLKRYRETGSIPFADLLRTDRPVAASLAAVLEASAHQYASSPETAGCLVLEGTHCNDDEVRKANRALHRAAEDLLRNYIAERHPEEANSVTDFVSTTMLGLSAKARNGDSRDQLLATARLASLAIAQAIRD